MKAYLMTTATVFGLIALAHVWRIAVEGPRLAKEPIFILLTLAATGLSAWGWVLTKRLPKR